MTKYEKSFIKSVQNEDLQAVEAFLDVNQVDFFFKI